jgi:hypothetical protein
MLSASLISQGQDRAMDSSNPGARRFLFGIQAGNGWACEDEVHLFNLSAGLTFDYKVADHLFLQFAPSYSWLWKWNEHYLSLPIHLRIKFGEIISLFAGPALTFDVGYFKDMGISAGAYVHLDNRFAFVLSVYAFTLYDYDIDYLYVPINISYRYSF